MRGPASTCASDTCACDGAGPGALHLPVAGQCDPADRRRYERDGERHEGENAGARAHCILRRSRGTGDDGREQAPRDGYCEEQEGREGDDGAGPAAERPHDAKEDRRDEAGERDRGLRRRDGDRSDLRRRDARRERGEDAVCRGVEGAEKEQAGDRRSRAEARPGRAQVREHEQEVAADEDARPAPPVGEPPERDREREVPEVGPDEQEREVRRGEVVALLEREVEEAVADREHAEDGSSGDDPPEPVLGHPAQARPDRRSCRGGARVHEPGGPRALGDEGWARGARGRRRRGRRRRTRRRRPRCSRPGRARGS